MQIEMIDLVTDEHIEERQKQKFCCCVAKSLEQNPQWYLDKLCDKSFLNWKRIFHLLCWTKTYPEMLFCSSFSRHSKKQPLQLKLANIFGFERMAFTSKIYKCSMKHYSAFLFRRLKIYILNTTKLQLFWKTIERYFYWKRSEI